jgi:hypothetical protein
MHWTGKREVASSISELRDIAILKHNPTALTKLVEAWRREVKWLSDAVYGTEN